MKISAITPTHNPLHLLELYQSFVVQEYKDWEWIIYTNGPGTKLIQDRKFDQLRKDPKVKIIKSAARSTKVGYLKHMAFKAGTGEARCILDSITSLQNGADMIWIETEKPHVGQIGAMMDEIRKVVPNAKLVYNNSPSFNWTLNFRQQIFDAWSEAGKDVSAYDRADLMNVSYDETELAARADDKIRTFQADSAREAGIFHHLITLPTYHTAALSTDNLAKEYFGEQGMLGYVAGVQRKEIRQGIACVKHQNMAGSDMGDDHKEYFAGEAALKASGKDNTMNQF